MGFIMIIFMPWKNINKLVPNVKASSHCCSGGGLNLKMLAIAGTLVITTSAKAVASRTHKLMRDKPLNRIRHPVSAERLGKINTALPTTKTIKASARASSSGILLPSSQKYNPAVANITSEPCSKLNNK